MFGLPPIFNVIDNLDKLLPGTKGKDKNKESSGVNQRKNSAFRCLLPFLWFALKLMKFGIKLFSACGLAACECLENELSGQSGDKAFGYTGIVSPTVDIPGQIIESGGNGLQTGLETITGVVKEVPDGTKIAEKLGIKVEDTTKDLLEGLIPTNDKVGNILEDTVNVTKGLESLIPKNPIKSFVSFK